MSTYSRSAIISLLKETLSQLRELSGQFLPCEPGDQFIIRLKMMENLARLAFNYSIKVSYLNECTEYAHMAEMLDDALLQLRRCELGYKASSYGVLVTREYESMCDALDLIDERLKTVRVVFFNPRNRKVNKNSKFSDNEDITEVRYSNIKTKTPYKNEVSCRVDENEYHKHTHYPVTPYPSPSPSPSVSEKQDPEYNFGCQQKDTKDDKGPMVNEINSALKKEPKVPLPSKEMLEAENTFNEFTRPIQLHLSNFIEHATQSNQEYRLILQCKEVIAMFKFIADNGDYIRNEPRFRNYQKNGGYSFMQICINKCSHLYKEITTKYDLLRLAKKRSNPTLRAVKGEALNTIEKAKKILCKHYIEHPVEKETVEYVIRYSYPNN